MFRHILPVNSHRAKFSQKISGQKIPQVKNAPGQKRQRAKTPKVKNDPDHKRPMSKNDREIWIVKAPADIKHLSVWHETTFPTGYMTPDKLLRTVMSFLCHFH